MALGSGDSWDETTPTDATVAVQIDDYNRDLRAGIRSRLAHEHEFPASQASTAAGGKHKFITMQSQTSKPTVSGTQVAAVYSKTVATGEQELFFEDEAGGEIQIVSGTSVCTPTGGVVQTISVLNSTLSTITATIPWDDTIPQITEGTQILTGTITPQAVGNQLWIAADVNLEFVGANNKVVSAFFLGTTANAISVKGAFDYGGGSFYLCNHVHHHVITASTAAAQVISCRLGPGQAGTITINGYTGSSMFGGVLKSWLLITEYKA